MMADQPTDKVQQSMNDLHQHASEMDATELLRQIYVAMMLMNQRLNDIETRPPKSAAQRAREYRARKKDTVTQNVTQDSDRHEIRDADTVTQNVTQSQDASLLTQYVRHFWDSELYEHGTFSKTNVLEYFDSQGKSEAADRLHSANVWDHVCDQLEASGVMETCKGGYRPGAAVRDGQARTGRNC